MNIKRLFLLFFFFCSILVGNFAQLEQISSSVFFRPEEKHHLSGKLQANPFIHQQMSERQHHVTWIRKPRKKAKFERAALMNKPLRNSKTR